MKKSQLIKHTAKRAGMSQDATASVVNAMLEVIAISIAAGEPVSLHGFGEFSPVQLPAMKSSLNGNSTEPKYVPARRSVGFRPSIGLKRRMNKRLING